MKYYPTTRAVTVRRVFAGGVLLVGAVGEVKRRRSLRVRPERLAAFGRPSKLL